MKKINLAPKHSPQVGFDPLTAFRLALGTIQLAGLIAIAGFMFIYGRQTFLGVRSPHTVSDLGFGMGEVCLGTTLLLLRHADRVVAVCSPPLLISGVYYAYRRVKRFDISSKLIRNFRYAALLSSLLLALIVLVGLELPVANLNDALVANISDQCESSSHSTLAKGSCNVWSRLKLAHPIPGSREDKEPQKKAATDTLERTYVTSVLLAILAWVLLYRAQFGSDSVALILQLASLIAVLSATVLLPYTFGKLFGWDWTPNINVRARTDDKSTRWFSGYLLDSSEQSIFVVNYESGVTTLKEFPRSIIIESDTSSNEDVLAKRLALSGVNPPAP